MKIITYNVNGIRSAISQNLINWVNASQPDILSIQESRSPILEVNLEPFKDMGYSIYWNEATKPGYSGVTILSKKPALFTQDTMKINSKDTEGRFLRIDIEDLTLLNIYVPAGSGNTDRLTFKFEWLSQFFTYITHLVHKKKQIIICGDFNISHKRIDIHNPRSSSNRVGFLPQERHWLDDLLDLGFIDTFRHFNQEPHQYTWWQQGPVGRKQNLGSRIDYILATESLKNRLKRSMILSSAHHSDHCPVLLELT